MSDTARVFLILVAVIIGLQLFGTWTGQTFSLNLLGPNQFGGAMSDAAARLRAQAWGKP